MFYCIDQTICSTYGDRGGEAELIAKGRVKYEKERKEIRKNRTVLIQTFDMCFIYLHHMNVYIVYKGKIEQY